MTTIIDAEPISVIDQPVEPDAPQVADAQTPVRCVMVIFEYLTKDGVSGKDRIFIDNWPALRTRQQIVEVETWIMQNRGETLEKAMIVDWQSLEA